jgi:hypothetical protein
MKTEQIGVMFFLPSQHPKGSPDLGRLQQPALYHARRENVYRIPHYGRPVDFNITPHLSVTPAALFPVKF